MRILVVDDSNLIRQAISTWLGRKGSEIVGQAKDGVEALQMYKDLKPDLVTLDITMPKMDGLETLEEIIKFDANAKVIIISALAAKEIAIEAIKKGAVNFVQKPFDDEDLYEALAEVEG